MKILSYGATGSQGQPVAQKLLAAGHQVRVLTRDPNKIQDLPGADVVTGDMNNIASLKAASEGQEGVFLHIPFFTPSPSDGLTYAKNALQVALEAGVNLVVWNAGGEIPEARSGNPAFDVRLDILEAIQTSGIPYIVLQPTAYMENFLGPWTREEIVSEDTFAYPTPLEVKMAWTATEDIGTFAVYAFAHSELAPLNLKVSGPERLNGAEIAERFSRALGRTIIFRAMPPEEFGEKLDAVFPGMGQGVAQNYAAAYEHPERFSSHVDLEAVLAKMPVTLTTLEQWIKKHAPAFMATATVETVTVGTVTLETV
jgi:uncharacterized protein YbjT (DUF2867 family)